MTHDSSEIILTCWIEVQKILIIINNAEISWAA